MRVSINLYGMLEDAEGQSIKRAGIKRANNGRD